MSDDSSSSPSCSRNSVPAPPPRKNRRRLRGTTVGLADPKWIGKDYNWIVEDPDKKLPLRLPSVPSAEDFPALGASAPASSSTSSPSPAVSPLPHLSLSPLPPSSDASSKSAAVPLPPSLPSLPPRARFVPCKVPPSLALAMAGPRPAFGRAPPAVTFRDEGHEEVAPSLPLDFFFFEEIPAPPSSPEQEAPAPLFDVLLDAPTSSKAPTLPSEDACPYFVEVLSSPTRNCPVGISKGSPRTAKGVELFHKLLCQQLRAHLNHERKLRRRAALARAARARAAAAERVSEELVSQALLTAAAACLALPTIPQPGRSALADFSIDDCAADARQPPRQQSLVADLLGQITPTPSELYLDIIDSAIPVKRDCWNRPATSDTPPIPLTEVWDDTSSQKLGFWDSVAMPVSRAVSSDVPASTHVFLDAASTRTEREIWLEANRAQTRFEREQAQLRRVSLRDLKKVMRAEKISELAHRGPQFTKTLLKDGKYKVSVDLTNIGQVARALALVIPRAAEDVHVYDFVKWKQTVLSGLKVDPINVDPSTIKVTGRPIDLDPMTKEIKEKLASLEIEYATCRKNPRYYNLKRQYEITLSRIPKWDQQQRAREQRRVDGIRQRVIERRQLEHRQLYVRAASFWCNRVASILTKISGKRQAAFEARQWNREVRAANKSWDQEQRAAKRASRVLPNDDKHILCAFDEIELPELEPHVLTQDWFSRTYTWWTLRERIEWHQHRRAMASAKQKRRHQKIADKESRRIARLLAMAESNYLSQQHTSCEQIKQRRRGPRLYRQLFDRWTHKRVQQHQQPQQQPDLRSGLLTKLAGVNNLPNFHQSLDGASPNLGTSGNTLVEKRKLPPALQTGSLKDEKMERIAPAVPSRKSKEKTKKLKNKKKRSKPVTVLNAPVSRWRKALSIIAIIAILFGIFVPISSAQSPTSLNGLDYLADENSGMSVYSHPLISKLDKNCHQSKTDAHVIQFLCRFASNQPTCKSDIISFTKLGYNDLLHKPRGPDCVFAHMQQRLNKTSSQLRKFALTSAFEFDGTTEVPTFLRERCFLQLEATNLTRTTLSTIKHMVEPVSICNLHHWINDFKSKVQYSSTVACHTFMWEVDKLIAILPYCESSIMNQHVQTMFDYEPNVKPLGTADQVVLKPSFEQQVEKRANLKIVPYTTVTGHTDGVWQECVETHFTTRQIVRSTVYVTETVTKEVYIDPTLDDIVKAINQNYGSCKTSADQPQDDLIGSPAEQRYLITRFRRGAPFWHGFAFAHEFKFFNTELKHLEYYSDKPDTTTEYRCEIPNTDMLPPMFAPVSAVHRCWHVSFESHFKSTVDACHRCWNVNKFCHVKTTMTHSHTHYVQEAEIMCLDKNQVEMQADAPSSYNPIVWFDPMVDWFDAQAQKIVDKLHFKHLTLIMHVVIFAVMWHYCGLVPAFIVLCLFFINSLPSVKANPTTVSPDQQLQDLYHHLINATNDDHEVLSYTWANPWKSQERWDVDLQNFLNTTQLVVEFSEIAFSCCILRVPNHTPQTKTAIYFDASCQQPEIMKWMLQHKEKLWSFNGGYVIFNQDGFCSSIMSHNISFVADYTRHNCDSVIEEKSDNVIFDISAYRRAYLDHTTTTTTQRPVVRTPAPPKHANTHRPHVATKPPQVKSFDTTSGVTRNVEFVGGVNEIPKQYVNKPIASSVYTEEVLHPIESFITRLKQRFYENFNMTTFVSKSNNDFYNNIHETITSGKYSWIFVLSFIIGYMYAQLPGAIMLSLFSIIAHDQLLSMTPVVIDFVIAVLVAFYLMKHMRSLPLGIIGFILVIWARPISGHSVGCNNAMTGTLVGRRIIKDSKIEDVSDGYLTIVDNSCLFWRIKDSDRGHIDQQITFTNLRQRVRYEYSHDVVQYFGIDWCFAYKCGGWYTFTQDCVAWARTTKASHSWFEWQYIYNEDQCFSCDKPCLAGYWQTIIKAAWIKLDQLCHIYETFIKQELIVDIEYNDGVQIRRNTITVSDKPVTDMDITFTLENIVGQEFPKRVLTCNSTYYAIHDQFSWPSNVIMRQKGQRFEKKFVLDQIECSPRHVWYTTYRCTTKLQPVLMALPQWAAMPISQTILSTAFDKKELKAKTATLSLRVPGQLAENVVCDISKLTPTTSFKPVADYKYSATLHVTVSQVPCVVSLPDIDNAMCHINNIDMPTTYKDVDIQLTANCHSSGQMIVYYGGQQATFQVDQGRTWGFTREDGKTEGQESASGGRWWLGNIFSGHNYGFNPMGFLSGIFSGLSTQFVWMLVIFFILMSFNKFYAYAFLIVYLAFGFTPQAQAMQYMVPALKSIEDEVTFWISFLVTLLICGWIGANIQGFWLPRIIRALAPVRMNHAVKVYIVFAVLNLCAFYAGVLAQETESPVDTPPIDDSWSAIRKITVLVVLLACCFLRHLDFRRVASDGRLMFNNYKTSATLSSFHRCDEFLKKLCNNFSQSNFAKDHVYNLIVICGFFAHPYFQLLTYFGEVVSVDNYYLGGTWIIPLFAFLIVKHMLHVFSVCLGDTLFVAMIVTISAGRSSMWIFVLLTHMTQWLLDCYTHAKYCKLGNTKFVLAMRDAAVTIGNGQFICAIMCVIELFQLNYAGVFIYFGIIAFVRTARITWIGTSFIWPMHVLFGNKLEKIDDLFTNNPNLFNLYTDSVVARNVCVSKCVQTDDGSVCPRHYGMSGMYDTKMEKIMYPTYNGSIGKITYQNAGTTSGNKMENPSYINQTVIYEKNTYCGYTWNGKISSWWAAIESAITLPFITVKVDERARKVREFCHCRTVIKAYRQMHEPRKANKPMNCRNVASTTLNVVSDLDAMKRAAAWSQEKVKTISMLHGTTVDNLTRVSPEPPKEPESEISYTGQKWDSDQFVSEVAYIETRNCMRWPTNISSVAIDNAGLMEGTPENKCLDDEPHNKFKLLELQPEFHDGSCFFHSIQLLCGFMPSKTRARMLREEIVATAERAYKNGLLRRKDDFIKNMKDYTYFISTNDIVEICRLYNISICIHVEEWETIDQTVERLCGAGTTIACQHMKAIMTESASNAEQYSKTYYSMRRKMMRYEHYGRLSSDVRFHILHRELKWDPLLHKNKYLTDPVAMVPGVVTSSRFTTTDALSDDDMLELSLARIVGNAKSAPISAAVEYSMAETAAINYGIGGAFPHARDTTNLFPMIFWLEGPTGGTGFAFQWEGIIYTNEHVTQGRDIVVPKILHDNTATKVKMSACITERRSDLCVYGGIPSLPEPKNGKWYFVSNPKCQQVLLFKFSRTATTADGPMYQYERMVQFSTTLDDAKRRIAAKQMADKMQAAEKNEQKNGGVIVKSTEPEEPETENSGEKPEDTEVETAVEQVEEIMHVNLTAGYSNFGFFGWSGLPIICCENGTPVGVYGNMSKTVDQTHAVAGVSGTVHMMPHVNFTEQVKLMKLNGSNSIYTLYTPTGSGKSTKFPLACACDLVSTRGHGLVVVLNPLRVVPVQLDEYMKSLIKAQRLNNKISIGYSVGKAGLDITTINSIASNKVLIVYISYGKYIQMMQSLKVNYLLLDEVHYRHSTVTFTINMVKTILETEPGRQSNWMPRPDFTAMLTATPEGSSMTDRHINVYEAKRPTQANTRNYVKVHDELYFCKTEYQTGRKHLIFVHSKSLVDKTASALKDEMPGAQVYRFYSGGGVVMSELLAFNSTDTAILVTTNAIESGLTPIGCTDVWDSGYETTVVMGLNEYSEIITRAIDKKSSIQRRGRAGRTTSIANYWIPSKMLKSMPNEYAIDDYEKYNSAAFYIYMNVPSSIIGEDMLPFVDRVRLAYKNCADDVTRLLIYCDTDPITFSKMGKIKEQAGQAMLAWHPNVIKRLFERAITEHTLDHKALKVLPTSMDAPEVPLDHYLFRDVVRTKDGETITKKELNAMDGPLITWGIPIVATALTGLAAIWGGSMIMRWYCGYVKTNEVFVFTRGTMADVAYATQFDFVRGYTAKDVDNSMLGVEDPHIMMDHKLFSFFYDGRRTCLSTTAPGTNVVYSAAGRKFIAMTCAIGVSCNIIYDYPITRLLELKWTPYVLAGVVISITHFPKIAKNLFEYSEGFGLWLFEGNGFTEMPKEQQLEFYQKKGFQIDEDLPVGDALAGEDKEKNNLDTAVVVAWKQFIAYVATVSPTVAAFLTGVGQMGAVCVAGTAVMWDQLIITFGPTCAFSVVAILTAALVKPQYAIVNVVSTIVIYCVKRALVGGAKDAYGREITSTGFELAMATGIGNILAQYDAHAAISAFAGQGVANIGVTAAIGKSPLIRPQTAHGNVIVTMKHMYNVFRHIIQIFKNEHVTNPNLVGIVQSLIVCISNMAQMGPYQIMMCMVACCVTTGIYYAIKNNATVKRNLLACIVKNEKALNLAIEEPAVALEYIFNFALSIAAIVVQPSSCFSVAVLSCWYLIKVSLDKQHSGTKVDWTDVVQCVEDGFLDGAGVPLYMAFISVFFMMIPSFSATKPGADDQKRFEKNWMPGITAIKFADAAGKLTLAYTAMKDWFATPSTTNSGDTSLVISNGNKIMDWIKNMWSAFSNAVVGVWLKTKEFFWRIFGKIINWWFGLTDEKTSISHHSFDGSMFETDLPTLPADSSRYFSFLLNPYMTQAAFQQCNAIASVSLRGKKSHYLAYVLEIVAKMSIDGYANAQVRAYNIVNCKNFKIGDVVQIINQRYSQLGSVDVQTNGAGEFFCADICMTGALLINNQGVFYFTICDVVPGIEPMIIVHHVLFGKLVIMAIAPGLYYTMLEDILKVSHETITSSLNCELEEITGEFDAYEYKKQIWIWTDLLNKPGEEQELVNKQQQTKFKGFADTLIFGCSVFKDMFTSNLYQVISSRSVPKESQDFFITKFQKFCEDHDAIPTFQFKDVKDVNKFALDVADPAHCYGNFSRTLYNKIHVLPEIEKTGEHPQRITLKEQYNANELSEIDPEVLRAGLNVPSFVLQPNWDKKITNLLKIDQKVEDIQMEEMSTYAVEGQRVVFSYDIVDIASTVDPPIHFKSFFDGFYCTIKEQMTGEKQFRHIPYVYITETNFVFVQNPGRSVIPTELPINYDLMNRLNLLQGEDIPNVMGHRTRWAIAEFNIMSNTHILFVNRHQLRTWLTGQSVLDCFFALRHDWHQVQLEWGWKPNIEELNAWVDAKDPKFTDVRPVDVSDFIDVNETFFVRNTFGPWMKCDCVHCTIFKTVATWGHYPINVIPCCTDDKAWNDFIDHTINNGCWKLHNRTYNNRTVTYHPEPATSWINDEPDGIKRKEKLAILKNYKHTCGYKDGFVGFSADFIDHISDMTILKTNDHKGVFDLQLSIDYTFLKTVVMPDEQTKKFLYGEDFDVTLMPPMSSFSKHAPQKYHGVRKFVVEHQMHDLLYPTMMGRNYRVIEYFPHLSKHVIGMIDGLFEFCDFLAGMQGDTDMEAFGRTLFSFLLGICRYMSAEKNTRCDMMSPIIQRVFEYFQSVAGNDPETHLRVVKARAMFIQYINKHGSLVNTNTKDAEIFSQRLGTNLLEDYKGEKYMNTMLTSDDWKTIVDHLQKKDAQSLTAHEIAVLNFAQNRLSQIKAISIFSETYKYTLVDRDQRKVYVNVQNRPDSVDEVIARIPRLYSEPQPVDCVQSQQVYSMKTGEPTIPPETVAVARDDIIEVGITSPTEVRSISDADFHDAMSEVEVETDSSPVIVQPQITEDDRNKMIIGPKEPGVEGAEDIYTHLPPPPMLQGIELPVAPRMPAPASNNWAVASSLATGKPLPSDAQVEPRIVEQLGFSQKQRLDQIKDVAKTLSTIADGAAEEYRLSRIEPEGVVEQPSAEAEHTADAPTTEPVVKRLSKKQKKELRRQGLPVPGEIKSDPNNVRTKASIRECKKLKEQFLAMKKSKGTIKTEQPYDPLVDKIPRRRKKHQSNPPTEPPTQHTTPRRAQIKQPKKKQQQQLTPAQLKAIQDRITAEEEAERIIRQEQARIHFEMTRAVPPVGTTSYASIEDAMAALNKMDMSPTVPKPPEDETACIPTLVITPSKTEKSEVVQSISDEQPQLPLSFQVTGDFVVEAKEKNANKDIFSSFMDGVNDFIDRFNHPIAAGYSAASQEPSQIDSQITRINHDWHTDEMQTRMDASLALRAARSTQMSSCMSIETTRVQPHQRHIASVSPYAFMYAEPIMQSALLTQSQRDVNIAINVAKSRAKSTNVKQKQQDKWKRAGKFSYGFVPDIKLKGYYDLADIDKHINLFRQYSTIQHPDEIKELGSKKDWSFGVHSEESDSLSPILVSKPLLSDKRILDFTPGAGGSTAYLTTATRKCFITAYQADDDPYPMRPLPNDKTNYLVRVNSLEKLYAIQLRPGEKTKLEQRPQLPYNKGVVKDNEFYDVIVNDSSDFSESIVANKSVDVMSRWLKSIIDTIPLLNIYRDDEPTGNACTYMYTVSDPTEPLYFLPALMFNRVRFVQTPCARNGHVRLFVICSDGVNSAADDTGKRLFSRVYSLLLQLHESMEKWLITKLPYETVASSVYHQMELRKFARICTCIAASVQKQLLSEFNRQLKYLNTTRRYYWKPIAYLAYPRVSNKTLFGSFEEWSIAETEIIKDLKTSEKLLEQVFQPVIAPNVLGLCVPESDSHHHGYDSTGMQTIKISSRLHQLPNIASKYKLRLASPDNVNIFQHQKVLATFKKQDRLSTDKTILANTISQLTHNVMGWHPTNSPVTQVSKDRLQVLQSIQERVDRPPVWLDDEVFADLLELLPYMQRKDQRDKKTRLPELTPWTFEEARDAINKQGAAGLHDPWGNMQACLDDPETPEIVNQWMRRIANGESCPYYYITVHNKVESKVSKRAEDGRLIDADPSHLHPKPRLISYFSCIARIIDWMVFGPYVKQHYNVRKNFRYTSSGVPLTDIGDYLWRSFNKYNNKRIVTPTLRNVVGLHTAEDLYDYFSGNVTGDETLNVQVAADQAAKMKHIQRSGFHTARALTGDASKWDHSLGPRYMMLEAMYIASHYQRIFHVLILNLFDHIVWAPCFTRLGFVYTAPGHRYSGHILTWHNSFGNGIYHLYSKIKALNYNIRTSKFCFDVLKGAIDALNTKDINYDTLPTNTQRAMFQPLLTVGYGIPGQAIVDGLNGEDVRLKLTSFDNYLQDIIEFVDKLVETYCDGDDNVHMMNKNLLTTIPEFIAKLTKYMLECGITIRSGPHSGYRVHDRFDTVDFLSHRYTPVPMVANKTMLELAGIVEVIDCGRVKYNKYQSTVISYPLGLGCAGKYRTVQYKQYGDVDVMLCAPIVPKERKPNNIVLRLVSSGIPAMENDTIFNRYHYYKMMPWRPISEVLGKMSFTLKVASSRATAKEAVEKFKQHNTTFDTFISASELFRIKAVGINNFNEEAASDPVVGGTGNKGRLVEEGIAFEASKVASYLFLYPHIPLVRSICLTALSILGFPGDNKFFNTWRHIHKMGSIDMQEEMAPFADLNKLANQFTSVQGAIKSIYGHQINTLDDIGLMDREQCYTSMQQHFDNIIYAADHGYAENNKRFIALARKLNENHQFADRFFSHSSIIHRSLKAAFKLTERADMLGVPYPIYFALWKPMADIADRYLKAITTDVAVPNIAKVRERLRKFTADYDWDNEFSLISNQQKIYDISRGIDKNVDVKTKVYDARLPSQWQSPLSALPQQFAIPVSSRWFGRTKVDDMLEWINQSLSSKLTGGDKNKHVHGKTIETNCYGSWTKVGVPTSQNSINRTLNFMYSIFRPKSIKDNSHLRYPGQTQTVRSVKGGPIQKTNFLPRSNPSLGEAQVPSIKIRNYIIILLIMTMLVYVAGLSMTIACVLASVFTVTRASNLSNKTIKNLLLNNIFVKLLFLLHILFVVLRWTTKQINISTVTIDEIVVNSLSKRQQKNKMTFCQDKTKFLIQLLPTSIKNKIVDFVASFFKE